MKNVISSSVEEQVGSWEKIEFSIWKILTGFELAPWARVDAVVLEILTRRVENQADQFGPGTAVEVGETVASRHGFGSGMLSFLATSSSSGIFRTETRVHRVENVVGRRCS